MEDYKLYYRDVNLKNNYIDVYKENNVISDIGMIDMTLTSCRPFTSHRYIIITNKAISMKHLEEDEVWNMYAIVHESFFQVIFNITYKKVNYICLLHLKDSVTITDKKIIKEYKKEAMRKIKSDYKLPINNDIATISWLERCIRPIGVK